MKPSDVKTRLFEIVVKKLIDERDIYEWSNDGLLSDYGNHIGETAYALTKELYEWSLFLKDDEDLL